MQISHRPNIDLSFIVADQQLKDLLKQDSAQAISRMSEKFIEQVFRRTPANNCGCAQLFVEILVYKCSAEKLF